MFSTPVSFPVTYTYCLKQTLVFSELPFGLLSIHLPRLVSVWLLRVASILPDGIAHRPLLGSEILGKQIVTWNPHFAGPPMQTIYSTVAASEVVREGLTREYGVTCHQGREDGGGDAASGCRWRSSG